MSNMNPETTALLASIPVLPPPPGEKSNFTDGESLGNAVIIVNSVFLALMLIAITIRIYTKAFIVRSLWWDDYMCLLGAIGSLIHSVLEYLSVLQFGFGHHLWDMRITDFTMQRIHMYSAIPILYPFNILAIKLSFLLLYLRLFGVQRTFRLVIFWAIAIQSFFYTGYFTYQVVYFNVCSRVDQHSIPFCLSTSQVVVSQGAFNVVTDFVILALPIRKVLALHLKPAQKFNLCLVFASGFIACGISLARLIFSAVRYGDPDSIYWGSIVTTFTIVEMNIGICAACMTALPPFFTRSRIFKLSTYTSIRSRLFTSRKESLTDTEDKSMDPSIDRKLFHGTYLELSDIQQDDKTMTVRGRIENLSPRSDHGIWRTDKYVVSNSGRGQ